MENESLDPRSVDEICFEMLKGKWSADECFRVFGFAYVDKEHFLSSMASVAGKDYINVLEKHLEKEDKNV